MMNNSSKDKVLKIDLDKEKEKEKEKDKDKEKEIEKQETDKEISMKYLVKILLNKNNKLKLN